MEVGIALAAAGLLVSVLSVVLVGVSALVLGWGMSDRADDGIVALQ